MPRRAGRSVRRPSEKVLLPALRNPARCSVGSNQLEVDAEWDDRRRFRRRRRRRDHLEPLPQLAYVYLPPVFPINGHHYDSDYHSQPHHRRTTKPLGWQHRRREYNDDSSVNDSSCDSSDENDEFVRLPPKTTTMRTQRMRSLAAMSKLQHDAASTIQREYRDFRRRQTNRNRRNQRLARQSQDFLNVFLLQEMTNLVPDCLLEVLRETYAQKVATTKRRGDIAVSLASSVFASLVNECIHDAFHDVLQAMVKSYFAQRIDLSRAATPTALAVSADILDDWTKELVADLLPEVVVELASEYTERQLHESIWDEFLHDQLQTIAFDVTSS